MASNTYEILLDTFDPQSGTFNITPDNTFEVFQAVHDEANHALRVNILNSGSSLFDTGTGTESIQSINTAAPNDASGSKAFAIGTQTTASGKQSFANGSDTLASGTSSHAEGEFTESSGVASHTGGKGNATLKLKASGNYTFNHSYQLSNTIQYDCAGDFSAILGGTDNNIDAAAENSIVLGGTTQSCTTSNTVMMPRIELTTIGDGIIMVSPDGTQYKVTIDNAGNLVSAAV